MTGENAMRVYRAQDFTENGIAVFKSDQWEEEPLHTHDFIEMVYILQGCAMQRVGDNTYPVKRGDLLFINYGVTHAFLPQPNSTFSYYNVIFKPSFVREALLPSQNVFELLLLTVFDEFRDTTDTGKSLVTFSPAERPEIEQILASMLQECETRDTGYTTVLKGYLNVLFSKVLRKMSLFCPADSDDIWQEILAYIDENLKEDLSLPLLAERCFYNPSYFSRAFRKKQGMTPLEYVTQRRVELAARLLTDTSLSVEEISRQCGFGDKATLYRHFRKVHHCTPREYRNR